jgi:hypothetical protein
LYELSDGGGYKALNAGPIGCKIGSGGEVISCQIVLFANPSWMVMQFTEPPVSKMFVKV